MEQGGFSLGKWQSNPPELIDNEEGEAIKAIADNAKPFGVSWDSNNDNFVFQFDKEKVEKAVETPRHTSPYKPRYMILWASSLPSAFSARSCCSKLHPGLQAGTLNSSQSSEKSLENGQGQSSYFVNSPFQDASHPRRRWMRPSLSFTSSATPLP